MDGETRDKKKWGLQNRTHFLHWPKDEGKGELQGRQGGKAPGDSAGALVLEMDECLWLGSKSPKPRSPAGHASPGVRASKGEEGSLAATAVTIPWPGSPAEPIAQGLPWGRSGSDQFLNARQPRRGVF